MLDCIQLTAPSYERIAYATALRLGYPDSGRADNMIAGEVRCSYETAMTIGKPKYCCNVSPIKSCGGEIIELAGFVIRSSKWAHAALRLHNPSTACCFALTLGAAVDERIETMQDEDFFKAFVFDAVCSSLAEEYADQAERAIARRMQNDALEATARFSPGYCDWGLLDGQREIFSFLNPESIGITMNEAGAMTPLKSITAVMICADEVRNKTACAYCGNSSCEYRRSAGPPL